MPFDGTKEEDLTLVRGREGLRRLALLLRKEMPHNFHWNFNTIFREDHLYVDRTCGKLRVSPHPCGTQGCAIGLAMSVSADFRKVCESALWGALHNKTVSDQVGAYFEIPTDVANYLFFSWQAYSPACDVVVTPTMVANKIDEYLNTGTIGNVNLSFVDFDMFV